MVVWKSCTTPQSSKATLLAMRHRKNKEDKMTATTDDLDRWIKQGIKQKATHLIIMHDTFDHDNYPVFVKPGENALAIANSKGGSNMQVVEECYNLRKPIEPQKAKHRCFDYDQVDEVKPKKKKYNYLNRSFKRQELNLLSKGLETLLDRYEGTSVYSVKELEQIRKLRMKLKK